MSLIISCIFTLFNFDIIIHVSMFCKQLKHIEVNTRCDWLQSQYLPETHDQS